MPIYEYEHQNDPGAKCQNRFEMLQSLSAPIFTACPTCGECCHRVVSSFATIKSERATISSKNLERLGFTQYKKAGDGHYEKTAGKGPRVIKK
jgi:putative FmdB family regulatory protein